MSGVVVPFIAADGSGVSSASLTTARPESSVRRMNVGGRSFSTACAHLDLDPVIVDSDESRDVVSSFLSWRSSACSREGGHDALRRPHLGVLESCSRGAGRRLEAADRAGQDRAVRGALTPDVHLFGEPVVATVEVIVDREQIEPMQSG